MSNGFIIYEGPSQIDGKPIVAIATGLKTKSRNSKTGGMVQTYILRMDQSPLQASQSGDDVSICGDCPHRGEHVDGRVIKRTCYVNLGQGPRAVYEMYQRGGYPKASAIGLGNIGKGRRVRLGAYGDPAAVPIHIWANLMAFAEAGTGYTHQWRTNPELAAWCMASADSPEDREDAKAMGFRTFRVRAFGDPTLENEVVCPASAEAGKKTNCATCAACGGNASKARADIVITVHGIGKRNFAG